MRISCNRRKTVSPSDVHVVEFCHNVHLSAFEDILVKILFRQTSGILHDDEAILITVRSRIVFPKKPICVDHGFYRHSLLKVIAKATQMLAVTSDLLLLSSVVTYRVSFL